MILPIGHENGGVRRLPWVTFGIMGLCVLALLVTHYTPPIDAQGIALMKELTTFVTEHPHVEIDEAAGKIVFAGMDARSRRAILEMYRTSRPREESAEERAEIQAEFDGLVASVSAHINAHPLRRFGLVPARPSIVTLITHMFLHVGLLHLLGNFLILYLTGPFVEDVWGRELFAGFYLAAGVVSALLFLAMHPAADVPLVGASGAIAGVMGAFLVRYWNTHIHFVYFIGLMFHGTFSSPAWIMLPMWFMEQVVMASMGSAATSGGGVAYWAHVGGFVFGVGVALAMKHCQVEQRVIRPRLDATLERTLVDNPVVDEALDARASGRPEAGFDLLAAAARRQPHNRDVALALFTVASEDGRLAEIADPALALIHDELRAGDIRQAIDHWRALVENCADLHAAPVLLTRIARILSAAGHQDEAAAALRLALLDPDGTLTAATALRIARVAAAVDPWLVKGAARVALAVSDISAVEKASAEALLAPPPGSA
ncbi:MAG: rhomboid family intramembrane serine protease [Acidobacteriota bacterium]